jgi:hypothetical protein
METASPMAVADRSAQKYRAVRDGDLSAGCSRCLGEIVFQEDKSVVDTGLHCIEAGHIPYRFRNLILQITMQSIAKPGR